MPGCSRARFEAVCGLPGVGRSTAAAICVFAFGARHAILDGNVKRVLARHEGIAGYPGAKQVQDQLWQRAEALPPESDLESYTQGLMDLGAGVCVRRNPTAQRVLSRVLAWHTGMGLRTVCLLPGPLRRYPSARRPC